MGLKIEIATDNDAFQGIAAEHCATLLEEIGRKLNIGVKAGDIYDGNGNKVGTFALDHTDAPES